MICSSLNLVRFIAWQNPVGVVLYAIGTVIAVRLRDAQVISLAVGPPLLVAAMALVLPLQGHGWGRHADHDQGAAPGLVVAEEAPAAPAQAAVQGHLQAVQQVAAQQKMLEQMQATLTEMKARLDHAEQSKTSPAPQTASAAPGASARPAASAAQAATVPAVLPGLLRLLIPGGIYWFTINYDGESIFAPGCSNDDLVMRAYHQDMDERIRYGRPAGESRTGRRLFHHLRDARAPALAAGSSDWVVHPARDGNYPADEAYFLRRILDTIRDALRNRPDRVEPADLADWLAVRCRQLAAGDLVYIAHQLDFAGRSPA